ncbi:dedicator of cytokinesis protein myoblast city [Arctopsyche grandis]|uniref:dedicator of cytokinesis protein myoblast city n=1 Tax=Arctopsyche grandis TaxID=121162 RepID=UPI00406D7333
MTVTVWRPPLQGDSPSPPADDSPDPPPQRRAYAVAIHNYSASQENSPPSSLSIILGELVEILSECEHWYFGRRLSRKPEERGIFPKTYVRLRECNVDRAGSVEVVSIVQPQIVQEITHTLREWGQHWKKLYVIHSEQFKIVEHNMRALLELKDTILSRTLPTDRLKRVQRTAMYTMDKGNRELNLDLTVRCATYGRLIDPSKVSTCQLCNIHVETTESIKKRKETSTHNLTQLQNCTSFSFFASVRNFVCKMSEDAELLMSLYDGTLHKPFTENYVVHWSKDGLASDISQLHNLKVIFTDLSSTDIKREKVYLVCYVIRVGGMEPQNSDNRRSSVAAIAGGRSLSLGPNIHANGDLHSKTAVNMRRPLGVAAMDITPYLSGQLDSEDDKQHCVPFFPCDKDNLESLLKKIIINKDLKGDLKTGQGLWISVKFLHGDLIYIKKELPALMVGNVSIARKMGFPEVILPSDARNDLYLCLLNGCFTRGSTKSSDRNIQVTVRVCNQHGETIPGVISIGGGVQTLNEYNSVIYYHEDRPRWNETFKICVPIEEFKLAHILFLFKHRSSNEAKDKSEKPFALSFTPLMQSNGTTLNDMVHNLRVYKVDSKKWPNDIDAASCYLTLPSQRSNMGEKEYVKLQKSFLSLSPKDYLSIETNVCSTKLTQNVELLGVLNWNCHVPDGTLRQSLTSLQSVPGGEIVKFLQDILDALFSILTQADLERVVDAKSSPYDSYDYLVFECLLYLITLVSDRKYHHFQPVLDLYIKESFSATLAYKKLCKVLSLLISEKPEQEKNEVLLKSMKCLEYLIRFIVKSRELHAELTQKTDQEEFHLLFQDLLDNITIMMQCSSMNALTSQGTCIKFLPTIVPHVVQVFPETQLSIMIGRILDDLPLGRLTKQRLMAVLDFVQGPLFRSSECRCILLPHITKSLKILIQNNDETSKCGVEIRSKNRSVDKIARILGASRQKLQEHRGYCEQLELCIKILSEILTLLFSSDVGSTEREFNHIISTLLRTVIISTSQMDRENPLVCQLVSVLCEMFRQMTIERYNIYVSSFTSVVDQLNFLIEVQVVLRDLVEKPVFSHHWADMINLQNNIVLKTLKLFSVTLVNVYLEPLKQQVWSNWFHLAIAFLTQPRLQLETLTCDQRRRLTLHYNDMRTEAAFEIKDMWSNLGDKKINFIPELVAPFLEMSLIPEIELRKATIPIFFDMMECEYNSQKSLSDLSDNNSDSFLLKKKFNNFENEMIHKLDVLVEGGKGDSQWRSHFLEISKHHWIDQPELKLLGDDFVLIIGRLLETLLQYRSLQENSSVDHRMQAITTLLEFYSKIKRPEMYIRYVNKLCELHLQCENWTEAGLTLMLHAKLLHWSNIPLNTLLKSHRHPGCQTHRDLKEALYYEIIQFLDKGKMWELALEVCKELVKQYEDEVFDYTNLSELYKKMANLYDAVMKQLRPHPEYFRVGYYGKGFPDFLQNKVFVYRGKEYERLQDFSSRTLNGLPNAELLIKLDAPSEEILNSSNQYVLINAVEPIMSEDLKVSGKHVCEQILKYHKFNDVTKFRFDRKFTKRDDAIQNSIDDNNEFASMWIDRTELKISEKLPGILRWFPVLKSSSYEMSPLQVAIDKMKETIKNLRALILQYKADDLLHLDPLTRTLSGIVDAAVMGGVANYEKAFFTEEYQNAHPENKTLVASLKDQIAMQIPLLEYCIEIHRTRLHISLAPLHKRIVECFDKMKAHVHANYGVKNCDLDQEISSVTMRRQISGLSNGGLNNSNFDSRWSEISTQTNNSEPGMTMNRMNAMSLKTSIASQFNKQTNRVSLGTAMGNSYSSLGLSPAGLRSQVSLLASPARKRDKDKRRTRKQSDPSLNSIQTLSPSTGSSQWYTSTVSVNSNSGTKPNSIIGDPVCPSAIFELRQELTPSRPLRSEVEREKRFSQRPHSLQSETHSNRNSAGTTDSNMSAEDDPPPPPLPQKTVRTDIFTNSLTSPSPDSYYQAINFSVNTPTYQETISKSALTSPIFPRQDYDHVFKPRKSSLYKSLQLSNAAASKKVLNIPKERAPTPPPKKRMNSVQH